MNKRQLAILAFAATQVLSHGTALADDKIWLKLNDFGPDRAFIEQVAAKDFGISLQDLRAGRYEPTYLIGRHDINHDGEPELFVVIASVLICGSAGCFCTIYEKEDGAWTGIGSMRGPTGPALGGRPVSNLIAVDEPGTRYQTLISHFTGHVWDGRDYISYCRVENDPQCLHQDYDAGPEAEVRARAKASRESLASSPSK